MQRAAGRVQRRGAPGRQGLGNFQGGAGRGAPLRINRGLASFTGQRRIPLCVQRHGGTPTEGGISQPSRPTTWHMWLLSESLTASTLEDFATSMRLPAIYPLNCADRDTNARETPKQELFADCPPSSYRLMRRAQARPLPNEFCQPWLEPRLGVPGLSAVNIARSKGGREWHRRRRTEKPRSL
jgi:hypothetical protein